MNTREMQDEIIRLKEEKDFCILAHAYQSHAIWEVADYVGDSYGLAVQASKAKNKNILMCGVRFMAETCKMLSPDRHVYLANSLASCPMAGQYGRDAVLDLRKQFPDYAVVCYVNTTAETKSVCDVAVTSSSALKIVKAMPEDKILFIPDCNLGGWIQDQCPEKTFHLVRGGCPTHMSMTADAVKACKAAHPDALFLVHPECLAGVTELADYVGSTTGILNYAKKSDAKEFIIGTEASIVEHLKFECPDKKFYAVASSVVCHNMRVTTLPDILGVLQGEGEEIVMSDQLIHDARKCIDKMIELG